MNIKMVMVVTALMVALNGCSHIANEMAALEAREKAEKEKSEAFWKTYHEICGLTCDSTTATIHTTTTSGGQTTTSRSRITIR